MSIVEAALQRIQLDIVEKERSRNESRGSKFFSVLVLPAGGADVSVAGTVRRGEALSISGVRGSNECFRWKHWQDTYEVRDRLSR